jgi:hypothetical protein
MSRTLELPDEVFADVEKAAKMSRTTPVEFIADVAKATIEKLAPDKPQSLYDQVKDLIGSFDSGGPDKLAEDPNDPFFNGLLQMKREGHL